MMLQLFPSKTPQTGAALIVSLVILILMTIIGLFSMRTSIMEEKMATNQRDRELAFQAAEIALRDAETFITGLSAEPTPTNNGANDNVRSYNSMDPSTTNATPWWEEVSAAWWTANGVQAVSPVNTNQRPRYIIEYIDLPGSEVLNTGLQPDTSPKRYYRITSRGIGGSAHSRVLLQTTLVKEY